MIKHPFFFNYQLDEAKDRYVTLDSLNIKAILLLLSVIRSFVKGNYMAKYVQSHMEGKTMDVKGR